MDSDDERVFHRQSFISYFDVSSERFPWREPRPQDVERRRALLGDMLIFDILLTLGGIREPDTLYPPADEEGLQRLLDAIQSSQYDMLKKECLVYFLLKWYEDGREREFQRQRSILPQFSALADAYWHLDTGINVAKAVSILSDSRLNRDYASKILQAISHSPNPSPLILKYVRTAKPLLTEPDDIDIYTLALAESNLYEAWQFQRTFNESDETRPRILKKILDWCISPTPRAQPLSQLLAIPLTPYEEGLLHSHALDPPKPLANSALAILQNLICTRLIQGGKYADAIKMDRKLTSQSPLKGHGGEPQDRSKMMQDLYSALSPTERALLDMELKNPFHTHIQGKPLAPSSSNMTTSSSGNANGDITMSQSWEEVRAPRASSPSKSSAINGKAMSSTPTPIRDVRKPTIPSSTTINERSGVPRFGGPPPVLGSSVTMSSLLNASANSTPRASPLPPVLPVSSSIQLNGAFNSSTSGTRKSFPFSEPFQPSSSGGPSNAAPAPIDFTSAVRKQNAFYRPPTNGVNKTLFAEGDGAFGRSSGSRSPERAGAVANLDVDHDMEMEQDDDPPTEITNGHIEDEQGEEFSRSVFMGNDNARPSQVASGKSKGTSNSRKAPPGAFVDDEDEAEEAEHSKPSPPSHRQQSRPQRQTRLRRESAHTNEVKPITARARGSKEQQKDLGRSLPGSLMDEDEEDEDDVAPLRDPSPPSKRLRKTRGHTSMSDAGSEDGGDDVPTRRRSSRLTSTAPSQSAESASAVKKGAASKTKKAAGTTSAKTTTGKRRR